MCSPKRIVHHECSKGNHNTILSERVKILINTRSTNPHNERVQTKVLVREASYSCIPETQIP